MTIFIRAARAAGKKPPANPIKSEKNNDHPTIEEESAKENSNSENEPKFSMEMEKN